MEASVVAGQNAGTQSKPTTATVCAPHPACGTHAQPPSLFPTSVAAQGKEDVQEEQLLPYQFVPCLNCKKFSTPYERMIQDSNGNVFCNLDCGWSALIRSAENYEAFCRHFEGHFKRVEERARLRAASQWSAVNLNSPVVPIRPSSRRPPRAPRANTAGDTGGGAEDLFSGHAVLDFDELIFDFKKTILK